MREDRTFHPAVGKVPDKREHVMIHSAECTNIRPLIASTFRQLASVDVSAGYECLTAIAAISIFAPPINPAT
jgi:hypothetical protein